MTTEVLDRFDRDYIFSSNTSSSTTNNGVFVPVEKLVCSKSKMA